MSLPDEKREALTWAVAEEACIHTGGVDPDATTGCRDCQRIADALAPLVADWLAEAEARGGRVAAVRHERDCDWVTNNSRCSCGLDDAYESGYERGRAEVAAVVGEAADREHAGGCYYRHQGGETDQCNSCAAARLEDALGDLGALDRVRAEALREATDWCEPIIKDAMGAVRADYADGWHAACDAMLGEIRDRADRIEGR